VSAAIPQRFSLHHPIAVRVEMRGHHTDRCKCGSRVDDRCDRDAALLPEWQFDRLDVAERLCGQDRISTILAFLQRGSWAIAHRRHVRHRQPKSLGDTDDVGRRTARSNRRRHAKVRRIRFGHIGTGAKGFLQ
jgi:hypothetical protein